MLHLEDRLCDCKPPLVGVLLLVIASVKESLFKIVDEEAVGSFATTLDGDPAVVVPDEVAMEQDLLKHGALRVGVWLGPPRDLIIVVEDVEQVFQHIQIRLNRTL